MATRSAEKLVRELFAKANIEINGNRPWDITINNCNFYSRVLAGGTLAFGESYMDGWWNSESVDQMICQILETDLPSDLKASLKLIWHRIRGKIINLQKIGRAYEIGRRHYDIGNDLFKQMLDRRMNYSCAYWKNANDLDAAQEAKLELICKKLELKEGEHVLDIGCGWGSFAKYAAERYGVKVTGITVSKEQQKLARELCAGFDVNILLMDYRDLNEQFDKIVSIGMFEHVGYKNYRTYFEVADRCLKQGGLFLLHTIGCNRSVTSTDPWIDKYIFPNSMLPSARQIARAFEGIFKLEDWHSFGSYYDNTLMAWYKNFNDNWDKIKNAYSNRFCRMWNYYLLSSAGTFRAQDNRVWQIVLSKIRSVDVYQSIR